MNGENANLQQAEPTDIANNKGMAVLGYILFFIPLLAAKESKFAMYHANQGLALFLALVSVNIVSSIIPIVGWLIIGPLANLGLFVLAILGIVNAIGGKRKPLPLIGRFRLIPH